MTAGETGQRKARPRFRRILMALDPSSEDFSTIEEAAALARRLSADLLSLFVEDIDLVRLAQHSDVSAFSTLLAGPRPLAAEHLRRALKLRLERSRQACEQAAARQRIKAVFEVRQGRPVAEIVSAAPEADLVVVQWIRRDTPAVAAPPLSPVARAVAEAATRPVLLLRPGAPADGPVLVVYGGSEVDRRALDAACEIAERDGGIVEVALLADRVDQADAWSREISELLARTHVTPRFLHTPRAGLEDLCGVATRRGVSLMVLGADRATTEAGTKAETGRRVLERAGCSVLLVR